jgi:hypothetical protein
MLLGAAGADARSWCCGGTGDEDRIFGEGEFIGESSAGRVRWKQAHKKGKFSGKPKPERKKRRL